ncbi:MAG: DUF192 domain-containing protein [Pseudomonadota bacterium]|nr:DUF192 domain-containing protein [Pseudomonadota bacterium]
MIQASRSLAPLRALVLLAGMAILLAAGTAAHAQQAPMILPADPVKLVAHTGQGEFAFTVEIADEDGERARGLMHRESMATDRGMLFDFGVSREVYMWMKNTPLSLDMVFVRADGTVARVAERTEPFSERTVESGEPVAYVLELRAGVARMIGLKPGDLLVHPRFAGTGQGAERQ